MDDILLLDVGGIKFKTTKSTLKKYPDTYFSGKAQSKIYIIVATDTRSSLQSRSLVDPKINLKNSI